ncbi:hypothetical protein EIP91_005332 [Steccherinum ochraceum]|uniref:F-box domain-containing protein n=1 Tax=Steccherinum ochraceum TaxID=92696 RepID=A0A4R0RFN7_9APHY|nr:hypothetical protein EIP91_005332 [Steccherinum ochraceum]
MAPRRSKRVKTSEPVAADSEPEIAKPVKTKQQLRTGLVCGSLGDLPKMPPSVIFEVLAYLNPRDLLSLARTTKPLRGLLLDRSSLKFWKAARRNVDGLPDCPPVLPEPEYACYAFETCCIGCRKHIVSPTDRRSLSRICTNCYDKVTVSHAKVKEMLPDLRTYPGEIFREVKQRGSGWRYGFLATDVTSFSALWKKANEGDRSALIKERKAFINTLSSFSEEIEDWLKTKRANRSNELAGLKRSREDAISAKLDECGWGDELKRVAQDKEAFKRFRAFSGVKDSKELTERVWNRLGPLLIDFLSEYKRTRLFGEYQKRLTPRLQAFSSIRNTSWCPQYSGYLPLSRHFALLPAIREILDDDRTTEITLASFKSLNIPEVIAGWKKGSTENIVSEINRSLNIELPLDTALDNLALGTFFSCSQKHCKAGLKIYPNVLSGSCRSIGYHTNTDVTIAKGDDYARIAVFRLDPGHTYAAWVFQVMRYIIEICGCDPLSASVTDMDALRTRLAFYTWRSALNHAYHNGRTSATFKTADGVLSTAAFKKLCALEQANANITQLAVDAAFSWRCKRCTDLRIYETHKANVISHVNKMHKVKSPWPKDVYLDPGCPTLNCAMTPVLLLSREFKPKDILNLPRPIQAAIEAGRGDARPREGN